MATRILRSAALCCAMLAAAAQAAQPRSPWRLVRFLAPEGTLRCANYSRSFGLWSTIATARRPGALLLRHGDILALRRPKPDDDEMIFTLYQQDDGLALSYEFDGHRLLLADKVVALRLEDDKAGWQWLDAATVKELAALRFVTIEDTGELDARRLALLKKLSGAKPDLDLAVADDDAFAQALPLFTPHRLIAPGLPRDEKAQRTLLAQNALEVLYVGAGKSADVGFLAFLPSLRRLGISDWKPSELALFPWGCRRLESLVLSDCGLRSLAPIEHLEELRELHLLGCGKLRDISSLRRMRRLEALTLSMDDELADFSVLAALPELAWLNVSCELDQERLVGVLEAAARLTTLELVGQKEIKSLEPLAELRRLRHLVLLGPGRDLSPLHGMKGLSLVMLPHEAFEKRGDEVAALEKALPRCTLAAGGVCLGSGWLLLLVPGAWAAYALAGRRRRRRAVRRG